MAHHNCKFSNVSGYGVVEVVSGRCEVGQGCDGLAEGCPFAWAEKDHKQTRIANRIFADFCKQLEQEPILSKLT